MPTHSDECSSVHSRRVLADGGVATVESCACGCIHLHMGPFTLRFREGSLHQLQETLTAACGKLAAENLAMTVRLPHLSAVGPD